jgi:hypothetical protein
MAVFITEIPDFRFSGLYFPQIWQSLVVYRRARMQELSDEDDNEPTIQILKAFGAGFHYGNVLLDFVALETLLPTSRLRESIRAHLLLIGYILKEAIPATAVMVSPLAAPLTSDAAVTKGTLVVAEATQDTPEILYEVLEDDQISQSDVAKQAWEDDGGVFTDITDEVNGITLPYQPFSGAAAAGDAIYYGFDVLPTRGTLHASVPGSGAEQAVEYYDGTTDDTVPTQVDDGGTDLQIRLTTLLGSSNRAGTEIVVRDLLTGAEYEGTSYWSGTYNVVDVPYFTVPYSLNAEDYLVGSLWKEVPNFVGEVIADVTPPGVTVSISWDLPESSSRQWEKTTVNGVEAYWLRTRWIEAETTSPTYDAAHDLSVGQYVKFEVTQGESQEDDPIGIFDGTLKPSFITTLEGVIEGSLGPYVDEGGGETEYEVVGDFLSSSATSKHVTLAYDADARAIATWGDGTRGYLPSPGSEAILRYRTGADEDGNVGANEITLLRSGPSFLTSVTNPRPATGWAPPEASTDESIAEVKITGPASLRLRDRAVTTDDMEELAEAYIFENGSQLVARAKAIANGFGDKTVKLLVVGTNGTHLTQSQLDELSLAFNGDEVAGIPGKLIAGLELTAVNYIKHIIDVTMEVEGGDEDTIETALAIYLRPDTQKSNGAWVHEFNGAVYQNQLIHAAMDADDDVVTVNSITDPSGAEVMGTDELPFPGTIAVTVV